MTVYIAGKMTGLPDHGRAKFNEAEKQLRELGYKVLNPAWLADDLPRKAYMPICLAMIDQADAIVLLKNWTDSNGARLEATYAEYQEIPTFEIAELIAKEV